MEGGPTQQCNVRGARTKAEHRKVYRRSTMEGVPVRTQYAQWKVYVPAHYGGKCTDQVQGEAYRRLLHVDV